jgi:glycosyltransferase involved in cell wall biosynthesis
VKSVGDGLNYPIRVAHLEMGMHLYGGAQQVLYLLRALRDQPVENVLICPEGAEIGKAAKESGLRVDEIAYAGELDWRSVGRIRRALLKEQIDLVHVHSRRGADVWGGLAARRLGLPCVISRRVDNAEARWMASLKYRLYARVIAISQGIADVLITSGVSAEKISCIRSAVDWQRFQRPADAGALKRRFGLPDQAVVAGIAAQLIPRKGHDLLVEAMAELVPRWPDLHVLVMGKGPLGESLRQDIEQRGLANHIHCVGFLEDLEQVLPSLDFLVHPARTEGLGVVLLQAASAGVAVIASNAGGMPEAVLNESTGLLIPPGDSRALTASMERLLKNPAERMAFGVAGRERMAQAFSIEVMAQGNLSVYQEVMAGYRD